MPHFQIFNIAELSFTRDIRETFLHGSLCRSQRILGMHGCDFQRLLFSGSFTDETQAQKGRPANLDHITRTVTGEFRWEKTISSWIPTLSLSPIPGDISGMWERPEPEGVSLSRTLREKNGKPWEQKQQAVFFSILYKFQQPYQFLLRTPSMTLPHHPSFQIPPVSW